MEDAVFFDGGKPTDKSWEVCRIDTPEDQAKTLALAGKRDVIVVETSDWTIIPLENMIAKFRSSGTKVYAIATRKEDAELYLKTMEKLKRKRWSCRHLHCWTLQGICRLR